MIGQTMVSVLLTSALLAIAARAAEEALHAYGRPLRWVWVSALVASALLPVIARMTGGAFPFGWFDLPGEPSWTAWPEWPAIAASSVTEAGVATSADRAFPAGAVLMLLWVSASIAAATWYAWTWRRLRRDRRKWRAARVGGTDVLISRGAGPVVIGMRKPSIVVPEWLLAQSPASQRLVMLHEREHVRAGDHALLALAPVAALLAPWNAPVWWLLKRLRHAVELDCDRRVLARGVAALEYGSVLLDVAGRSTAPSFAAALAEPRTSLERRLMAMCGHNPRRRFPRVVALTAACVAALALACETAAPADPDAVRTSVVVRADEAAAVAEVVAARSQRPVIVVDGEIVESKEALATIDPDMIESIEVTRPGVRTLSVQQLDTLTHLGGRNGVIHIRTKEAVPGELELQRKMKNGVADVVISRADDEVVVRRVPSEIRIAAPAQKIDPGLPGPAEITAEALKGFQRAAVALKRRTGELLAGDERAADVVRPKVVFETRVTVADRVRPQQAGEPLYFLDDEEITRERMKELGLFEPGSRPRIEIDRIEVIKGPTAIAMFGERAQHGVIRIYTKKKK
jgi:beta-lactamase regulating signal transducer with metallopeptidase domain